MSIYGLDIYAKYNSAKLLSKSVVYLSSLRAENSLMEKYCRALDSYYRYLSTDSDCFFGQSQTLEPCNVYIKSCKYRTRYITVLRFHSIKWSASDWLIGVIIKEIMNEVRWRDNDVVTGVKISFIENYSVKSSTAAVTWSSFTSTSRYLSIELS